jgi:hypothetical protein
MRAKTKQFDLSDPMILVLEKLSSSTAKPIGIQAGTCQLFFFDLVGVWNGVGTVINREDMGQTSYPIGF